jgi:hypothetical protein
MLVYLLYIPARVCKRGKSVSAFVDVCWRMLTFARGSVRQCVRARHLFFLCGEQVTAELVPQHLSLPTPSTIKTECWSLFLRDSESSRKLKVRSIVVAQGFFFVWEKEQMRMLTYADTCWHMLTYGQTSGALAVCQGFWEGNVDGLFT